MDDRSKTNDQLMAELAALRAEVATLKQQARNPGVHNSLMPHEYCLSGFFNGATQSNVGLLIVDTELRCLQVNQALANINERSIAAHQGQCLADLLPDLAGSLLPALQSLIETGQPISNLEVSGSVPSQPDITRYWLASFFPLTDASGTINAIGGIIFEITDSKQTLEALRQSEENLRMAQKIAHVGSWHWDRVAQAVHWSKEMYHIHGCDPTQPPPQGTELEPYIHPEDWATYQTLTEQAHAGHSFEIDLRIVRPDGEVRYVEARGEPGVFNEQGELLHLFGTLLDVTERKRVEEALRKSEFALREAQRLAHVGSWQWTYETGAVWSEEIYRIHGLDPSIPNPPTHEEGRKQIHPDDLGIHEAIYAATIAGQPYEFDLRIVRPDGAVRYVEARGVPAVRNEQGDIIELFGTVMDVTDRKHIEEKLRRNEAEIRAILSAIPDMLIRVKKDGTRLFLSEGSVQSYCPLENLVGGSVYDSLPTAIAHQRMAHVEKAIETKERQVYEYEIIINGDLHYEEARIVAINEEEALIVVRDMTENKRLERLKTEFISVVSHELRTPLTSMQVALSLLDEQLVDPTSEDGHNMIHVATEGVDRLVRLVNDILDLERLQSGKLRIKKQPCKLSDLIDTAIDQMKDLANRSNITIETAIAPYSIHVDPDRLVQVLTNLLSNAIRFSPPNSIIEIVAESVPPLSLQFSVNDKGRGIPTDQLERIFERFQQVDASDSREKSGTGLGLAICRSIIHQHGGQIWAESNLGEGSTFYFTIPILGDRDDDNEANFIN